MPVQEICVCPSAEKKDKTSNDDNDKAMLQSIVSTYPASMQNGSPPLSSPSATCDICRICHCESEPDSPLIAPCICSGSLRYVHQACLQQWIKSSNTRKCELCKFEFIMQTKIKPFSQWEKLQMSSVERRKIFCSVTFHFVAITCVVWSLYVLIDRTADEVQAGLLEWPFWTKLIVVAIGFSGGLVFMYVQCKLYVQLCRRWKAFNRIIYVQNAPPKAISAAVIQNNSSSATSTTSHPTPTTLNTTVSICLEPTSTSSATKLETVVTETTPSIAGVVCNDEKKQQVTLCLSPVLSSPSSLDVVSSKNLSTDPEEQDGLKDVGVVRITTTTVVSIPEDDVVAVESVQRLT